MRRGLCHLGGIPEQPLHLWSLYLPFYSPELFGVLPTLGLVLSQVEYPSFLPFSPALLILWIPGLFRVTCYYYRGAYYKSFWGDPPACAVGEPWKAFGANEAFRSSAELSSLLPEALLYCLGLSVYDAVRSSFFPMDLGSGLEALSWW